MPAPLTAPENKDRYGRYRQSLDAVNSSTPTAAQMDALERANQYDRERAERRATDAARVRALYRVDSSIGGQITFVGLAASDGAVVRGEYVPCAPGVHTLRLVATVGANAAFGAQAFEDAARAEAEARQARRAAREAAAMTGGGF